MAIAKVEFYEGAALYQLARSNGGISIKYDAPFFQLNNSISVLLKYSTRGRSPWSFTFTPSEQASLERRTSIARTAIALVCGSDGIAAFDFRSLTVIAPGDRVAFNISCYRRHGEHYEVSGPNGTLPRKIAPSNWRRLLQTEEARHEAL